MPSPSSKDLKATKIGKVINKIAKYAVGNEGIKNQALDIISKWKKDLKNEQKKDIDKKSNNSPKHKPTDSSP